MNESCSRERGPDRKGIFRGVQTMDGLPAQENSIPAEIVDLDPPRVCPNCWDPNVDIVCMMLILL
jgi:hypothetical protein